MKFHVQRRGFRIFAVLLAFSLSLLTACSSSTDSGEGTASSPAGSASPAATGTTPGSTASKSFTYILQQAIKSIDPAKATDETQMLTAINTYDPLFYPDVKNGKMDPLPHVAASYSVSDDGKVYTMKIKNNIAFQSGNKLKAADVVYSMRRALAIGEGNSWLWSSVLSADKVKAPDEYTVEFHLNTPYAPFISSLTQLFVVDSEDVKAHYKDGKFGEDKDFGLAYLSSQTSGSGPYKMVSWNQQSEMVLTAFKEYWKGWQNNQIANISLKVVTEEATVKTLLVSGEAQMVHKTLTVNAYQELAKNSSLQVDSVPSAKLLYLPMNTQKAPTDDINIRKAIALAFDYQTALTSILGGATPAAGPVPMIVSGHNTAVQPLSRNLEEAKKLVGQSKYSGASLKVSFMYIGDNVTQRQLAQLVQSNLKDIGIQAELKPVTWTQITEASAKKETTENLTVITTSLSYPHEDAFLYGLYHPSSHGNYNSMSWFENSDIAALLEHARTASAVEEQNKSYNQAQEKIVEQYPAVYISNPNNTIAYSKKIQGYKYVGLMGYDLAFYNLSYAAN